MPRTLLLGIMMIIIMMDSRSRIHGLTTMVATNRHRPWTVAKSSTRLGNGEDTDGWKAGDVYGDLNRLEQAITLANAEQNLQHMERIQLLNHHAQARRPLDSDVSTFVVAPLVLALFLRVLPVPLLGQILATASNLQFWTMTVMAPILLWMAKRIVKRPPEPMPEELQRLAPEYLEFLTTIQYERPEKSCRDSALVLLEYWASAVAMMALSGLLRICTKGWMTLAQLVIRIAVVASLYQNPQQVYELRRPQQPRPMTFFPYLLQPLITNMLALLPFGIALDLYQILLGFSKDAMMSFYGTALIVGVGLSRRLQQARQQDGLTSQLPSWNTRKRWLYIAATMVIWRRPIATLMTTHGVSWVAFQGWLAMRPQDGFALLQKFLTKGCIDFCQGVFLLLVPLLHVRALGKLVRVVHTHDLSLATNAEDLLKARQQSSRTKWRYRLEWQEESKRLGQAFKEWRDNLGYWLFFEGRVEDQMVKERKEKLAESPMTNQDWRLSDRVLDEVRQEKTFIPPDQWKKNAMEMLAQKHQMDYDRKQFDDPLGVAVQQTLGIGLGFNFDHDSPLAKGQTPSLRRLQARAAKSAIRRVQELYDADAAAKELAAVSDPKKRNAKALELRQRTQQEIETLAKRLTDLVPPNNGQSIEFKDRILMQRYKQIQPSNFVRVSSHEFRALDPMEAVSLVERDLDAFDNNKVIEDDDNHILKSSTSNNDTDDYLGEGSSSADPSSSAVSETFDDEEFLEEYLRQQKADFSNNDEDDSDNNTNVKVVLA